MKKVRLALVVMLAMAAFGFAAPQSHAATSLICNGAGRVVATPQPGGGAVWHVSGGGSCFEPFSASSEPRTVTFNGVGTSDNLGLCTPGSLLVTNLKLLVHLAMVKTGTGGLDSEDEVWSSPVSVFPLATPFLVNGLAGAGVAIHRIHLGCGNDGAKPAATFLWTRLL